MNKHTLHILFVVTTLCFSAIPLQSRADTKTLKNEQSAKERLVLMPLRVSDEDKPLQGSMETALVEGLKLKYEVFAGERVSQKAHEIFMKESRNTAHTECDETRCMQNIAEAFQAELIATANVTKQGGGYFLALSIQNIFDNKVEFSKTLTCEGCNAFKVVEKLKILGGVVASSANDTTNEETQADRKLKAEQLKKEQREFEERLRNADADERKKLLDAKAADDKHLAELKASVEAQRKNNQAQTTTFPTLEQAQPEITKLNEKVAAIEASYQKELADTQRQVKQRYSDKLDALDNEQRNEFESKNEFKTKQEKNRNELITQRDAELSRLNVSSVAETETAPLKARIKALTEHEYIVGAEGIEAELGSYDSEDHQFTVKLRSKNSVLKLKLNGNILMQGEEAKIFNQQWRSGLIRPEAHVMRSGDLVDVAFLNDADNSRLLNYEGRFMSPEYYPTWKQAKAEAEGYVFLGRLIWMPVHSKSYIAGTNWSGADYYCNNTEIYGQTGWRLPTINELSNLYYSGVLQNKREWKLDTFFDAPSIWSVTMNSFGGHKRFAPNGGIIDVVGNDYSLDAAVTCVREYNF
jgi:hypothetical protein